MVILVYSHGTALHALLFALREQSVEKREKNL
jgi:hypothetical protein